jgi:hypothetical protein
MGRNPKLRRSIINRREKMKIELQNNNMCARTNCDICGSSYRPDIVEAVLIDEDKKIAYQICDECLKRGSFYSAVQALNYANRLKEMTEDQFALVEVIKSIPEKDWNKFDELQAQLAEKIALLKKENGKKGDEII